MEPDAARAVKLRRPFSSGPGSGGNHLSPATNNAQTQSGRGARSLVTQSQVYPSVIHEDHEVVAEQDLRRRKSSIASRTSAQSGCGIFGGEPIKMIGYLEKRSKVIGWKRYWFVLDGHLLTYYKSKADYDSLCPCVGSINLGIASTVRPLQIRGCKGYPLQITTRSQIYYLRSLEKSVLEKWLIALQETTSTPPEISNPTWADPGVQFYRYSFASGSQWSLAAISTDDITGSLSNLPRNFYLKSSKQPPTSPGPAAAQMKKCQSLASLSHPTPATTKLLPTMPSKGKSRSREVLNLSLPPTTAPQSASTSSSPRVPAKMARVRQATSMIVLPSSSGSGQQIGNGSKANALAEDFKRELEQKLSSVHSSRQASEEREQVEPQSPAIINKIPTNSIQYDEIVDYEADYKDTRHSAASTSTSTGKSSSASSASESGQSLPTTPNPSLPSPTSIEGDENLSTFVEPEPQRTPNPWEKRFEPASISNSVISSPTPSWRAQQAQSRIIYHVEDELESSMTRSSGSLSGNGVGRKKKGIGGFFNKIFKKDKEKEKGAELGRGRSGSQSRSSQKSLNGGGQADEAMIITGPIDLRARARTMSNEVGRRPGPTSSPKAIVAIAKEAPSTYAYQTPIGQAIPRSPLGAKNVYGNNDSVIAELKSKVNQQLKRLEEEPKVQSLEHKLSNQSQSSQEGFSTVLLSVSTNEQLQEMLRPEIEAQAQHQEPPAPPRSKSSQIPTTTPPCPHSPAELKDKLDKFTRLSAHLNPTFVAALNRSHENGMNGHMNRSNSLSTRLANHKCKDDPPLLPPKKRLANAEPTKPRPPAYDVPQNNQPIEPDSEAANSGSESNSKMVDLSSFYAAADAVVVNGQSSGESSNGIRLLRDLTKKNSAPDVYLGHHRSSTTSSRSSFELLPALLSPPANGEPPSEPPPPIPSEPCLELAPGLDVVDCPCQCQTWPTDPTDALVPIPQLPVVTVLFDGTPSPPGSNKSIDIDNLDALSDISTTTPPHTPYLIGSEFEGSGTSRSVPLYANTSPSALTHPELEPDSSSQEQAEGAGVLYENLPIRYATINTIVTELETVEEYEDELYDEFVIAEPAPPPPGPRPSVRNTSTDGESDEVFLSPNNPVNNSRSMAHSVRHSGIDQLQQYLMSESSSNLESTNPGGAINRLGHSAAVNQLHSMLGESSNGKNNLI